MGQQPVGTVTFLMTDVEGSTRAWEAAPDRMLVIMARHLELVGGVVERHGGFRPVEQGEGDSVVAGFARPGDAVAAALDAQLALAAEPSQGGGTIAVRMAVHTGESFERAPGRYDGPALIRCARLRGTGHGGQILVSDVTASLVRDHLPVGAGLILLGVVTVKGQARPERVWQLTHPGLRATFPTLRASVEPIVHVPASLTSFVGRAGELAELDALTGHHRLVTILGAGGAGKTRLAAVWAVRTRSPGGTWFVDLSDVASAVTTEVGGSRPPLGG